MRASGVDCGHTMRLGRLFFAWLTKAQSRQIRPASAISTALGLAHGEQSPQAPLSCASR